MQIHLKIPIEKLNQCFSVHTIEDLRPIQSKLLYHYPPKKGVKTGVWELLINAIEHGNLGITGEEKSKKKQMVNDWFTYLNQQMKQPEHASKQIWIELVVNDNQIILSIEDQGNGFDWSYWLSLGNIPLDGHNGAGIFMAKSLYFDGLSYQKGGRKVVATTTVGQIEHEVF